MALAKMKGKPAKSQLHAFTLEDLAQPEAPALLALLGKHPASHHLADEREAMEAKARAARAAYDDATLARWYAMQLEAVQGEVARVGEKLMRNLDRMAGAEVDDPRWRRYWRQQALYAYLASVSEDRQMGKGTLPLLEEAAHVLVCPSHGIDGDVFLELAPEHNEGLSLLGILEDGLATHASWQRHCSGACASGALDVLAGWFEREWAKTS